MMKYFIVAFIVMAVIVTYILVATEQPMVNDIIETANASANWTGFESAQNAMNAYPIYLWLIPGLVGLIFIVMALKGKFDDSGQ